MGYSIICSSKVWQIFGASCVLLFSWVCRAETCSQDYRQLLIRDVDARDRSLVVQEKILSTRQEVLRRDPPLVRDRRGKTVLDKSHARETLREILDEVKEANSLIAQLKALESVRLEAASGVPEREAVIRQQFKARIEGVEGTIEKLKNLGKSILKFGDPYH